MAEAKSLFRFPALAVIARELRLLGGLGLLKRDRAARAGGFRAPSVYQLHLDASVCSEAVRALRNLQEQPEECRRCYLGKSQFPLAGTMGDFDSPPLEGTVKCAQDGISEHADA